MSIFETIKNKLFQPEDYFPLPDIYKILAHHLLTDVFTISNCGRILHFADFSATIVNKEKTIVVIVYSNLPASKDETVTPMNFNPHKMAEYDKCFWAGIQLKLNTLLKPIG